MFRDFIDLANSENIQTAFIFIDQEKAFDRVDHGMLFKTMKAFGIGQGFIRWVHQIYSNATTKIQINGHLSEKIPLNRGVRQGDPLSFLLYVLVIELFSLQSSHILPTFDVNTVNGETSVANMLTTNFERCTEAFITCLQYEMIYPCR